jgi:hypothetical protein
MPNRRDRRARRGKLEVGDRYAETRGGQVSDLRFRLRSPRTPRLTLLIGAWSAGPKGDHAPQDGALNFALANCNLPVIILCLSARPGWRVRSRIDVSVAAVRYRAFVFAAPPYFVAGNRSTEFRGAVSVGAVSPARGDASKILTVPWRGCPGFGCLLSNVR